MNTTHDMRKLRWKCRRGMLELDYLLLNFVDHGYENLSSDEKKLFSSMLDCTDPELYQWFIKQEIPPSKEIEKLVHLILSS